MEKLVKQFSHFQKKFCSLFIVQGNSFVSYFPSISYKVQFYNDEAVLSIVYGTTLPTLYLDLSFLCLFHFFYNHLTITTTHILSQTSVIPLFSLYLSSAIFNFLHLLSWSKYVKSKRMQLLKHTKNSITVIHKTSVISQGKITSSWKRNG